MPRILLVDDDIAEISAVKRVLARSGHQPVLATNASDAMAAVNQLPPDLLVVGATCESGEALAMAARIASGEAGIERFPMLVLGEGPGTPEGAVVIPRPVDPAQLADQVARALGGAQRAPAEPPSPGRRTAQPVARIAPSRAPSRGATIIPPPPPGPPPPAPAPAPAAAPAPAVPARRVTDARPPRASPPPRHDAPAAAPRPALSVEVTAALEPLSAREAARPSARSAPPPPPGPDARRMAAAEALRARAEELRRATPSPRPPQRPISEEVVDDELDALLERVEERPVAELAAELEADLGMTESAAPAPAEQGPLGAGLEPEPSHEAQAAELQAAAEARALAAAEAELEARRARDAEARVQAEADARRGLEAELERLRRQLEDERRGAERELARERERSAASSDAAEELSRLAEEQASERAAEEARRREEQEEELRRAIESARADMEALRRRNEDEARRRAEVEAELARLTQEAARKAVSPPTPSAGPETRGTLATFDFPEPAEPMPPPPDPAEEEARLRALASARADAPEGAAPAGAPGRAPAPPPLPPPELRSGTLADLPAPRLFALAWKARLAGRLDFQGAAARSIHFEDGRVVGATSAEPSERLEELALRLGLVTRDQYRQAAPAAAALPPRRAALLLLERGYLKPNELTGLVRRRAEEILFGLFVDESARFRWVGAEVPPEERVGLDRGTLALAVEGIRRRWLAPRLDAVLGGASTLLQPTQGGPSAGELALSAEERKVVALADGLRTLDEIEAASPLDPLSTRQVLAALVLAGGLTVRVLGAGRAAGIAAAAIDLARVRDKLDQARRADYFTILGVGRLCTPHEVREAAARLTAEFAPARFQGVREEGLPSRLDEILRVVADAREVLADERLREEYLKGLGE